MKWWNPFRGSGKGSDTWAGYKCRLPMKDHSCDKERDHGWQHTCACGIRWAK